MKSVLLLSNVRHVRDKAGRDRMMADLLSDLEQLEGEGRLRLSQAALERRPMSRALLRWLTSSLTLPESLYTLRGVQLPVQVDVVLIVGWPAQSAIDDVAKAYPSARIVSDLDDAYPDRLRGWSRAGIGYAFGMLGNFLPSAIRKALEGAWGRPLNWLERSKGRRRVARIARIADAIYLSGGHEAQAYADRFRGQCAVYFMPPAFQVRRRPPARQPEGRDAMRFVFVGSDKLVQNATSIRAIRAHWDRLSTWARLDLYSSHETPFDVPGWHYLGFAESMSDVFSDDAVLLYPATVAGGIKIKLVEAFEHGCPVVTTRIGIEGFALAEELNGLWIDFDQLLQAPPNESPRLPDPERIMAGQDLIAAHFASCRALGLRQLHEEDPL